MEKIRMECMEQAETLPRGELQVTILMAQAQILSRLAEELDTHTMETAEYEYDDSEDNFDPGGPSLGGGADNAA